MVVATAVLLGGCARAGTGSPTASTPADVGEFTAACGRPGASVRVLAVPVTVPHRACDLTGVELRYGLAAVVVPQRGHAERTVETFAPTTAPTRIAVQVDDATRDVTVTGG